MLLGILSILLLGLTLAAFYCRIWWCEIVDYFRLQMAGVALLFFLSGLLTANFFSVMLNIASMALNIYRSRNFLPRFSPGGIVQDKDVLFINAWKQTDRPELIGAVIDAAEPSLVLIAEFSPRLEEKLKPVLEEFPHRLATPTRGRARNCLYSKCELKEAKVIRHAKTGAFLIYAKTKLRDREWQIVTAHPKPGFNRKRHETRAEYFEKIEPVISGAKLPVLLMGDFAAVPWGSRFKEFLLRARLCNPLKEKGYAVTWPAKFPLLGVPMDYILLSESENYRDLHIGPFTGSSHFPVSIKLQKPGEQREKRKMELKSSRAVGQNGAT